MELRQNNKQPQPQRSLLQKKEIPEIARIGALVRIGLAIFILKTL